MVDIKDFRKEIKSDAPEYRADYLYTYYRFIMDNIAHLKWRFIKGLGDSVLISADVNNRPDDINTFYKIISKKYNVILLYRKCNFVEKNINIDSYSCFDVFGDDINYLFLNDSSTIELNQVL